MERDELDELLYSVYRKEIAAPPGLVRDTTQKLMKAQGIHYILGVSIVINILTFISMMLFIALVPKGILVKIVAFVSLFCTENLIIALIILFKDKVNAVLKLI